MVALAVHPARQADLLADMGSREAGAIMGTVGVHDRLSVKNPPIWEGGLNRGAAH
jgi:hypothetical protein